jgi:uncharacterized membrane protein YdjX (TVP38/TMEM64 family)
MSLKRWLPLLLVIVLMGVAYFSGVTRYLSFDTLKACRNEVLHTVAEHPLAAPLLFILLYSTATALSLPVGAFLSVTGGFLFAQPMSTFYVVVGATGGATALFSAAQTAIGERWRKKLGQRLRAIERGWRAHSAHYLLFLRLVPLFPFWLVNIAPAILGVPLRTYLWTTALGIIPGAFVFTQMGTGLGAVLDAGTEFSAAALWNWQMRLAFAALGLFALLPIIFRAHKQRHD